MPQHSGSQILPNSNPPVTGNSAVNYSTAQAGAQVKTGKGLFVGFNLNTVGSGSTMTAYDGTSTSGTKLGTWSTATLFTGGFVSAGGPNGIAFTTGLFIVTTTTAPDITIIYR